MFKPTSFNINLQTTVDEDVFFLYPNVSKHKLKQLIGKLKLKTEGPTTVFHKKKLLFSIKKVKFNIDYIRIKKIPFKCYKIKVSLDEYTVKTF